MITIISPTAKLVIIKFGTVRKTGCRKVMKIMLPFPINPTMNMTISIQSNIIRRVFRTQVSLGAEIGPSEKLLLWLSMVENYRYINLWSLFF